MDMFTWVILISLLLTLLPDFVKYLKLSSRLLGRVTIAAHLQQELTEAQDNLEQIRNAPSSGEYNKLIKTMRAEQKVQDVLNKVKAAQAQALLKQQSLDIIACYGIKIALMLILIVINWRTRSVPVLIFEDNVNLQPFTGLISFPTGIKNAVSVNVWSMVCNVTFRLFYGLVKNRK